MALSEPLSVKLTAIDAWGTGHAAHVTWLPEDLIGLDLASENLGRHSLAFHMKSDPPVELFDDPSNHQISARSIVKSFSSSTQMTVEFTRVDTLDQVEQGTYFLEWLCGCHEDE